MSIKILTGFKVDTTDLFQLMKWVNEYRGELDDLIKVKQAKYIATRAASFFDRCMVFNQMDQLKESSAYSRAAAELTERQARIKREGKRDPDVDFEVTLRFFTIENSPHLLGIGVAEQQDLFEVWSQKPFVEKYCYWDNTDRPDDISDSEWKCRREEWDKALLSCYYTPSLAGFSIGCSLLVGRTKLPDLSAIMRELPDLNTRIETMTLDIMFTEYFKKLPSGSNPFTEYTRFKEWLGTEEGKSTKELKYALIQRNLKLLITERDLTGAVHIL